jgi:autotransporter strand-loop-strand O-heptosyltransferase
MISGFTDPKLEFTQNCIRIHNDTVCNGCFTNPIHKFDKGDWSWCPTHKGTDRQFECTKVITPTNVFDKIKNSGIL